MALPFIGPLIEAGLKIIDKVIPDPQAKMAAQLELMRLNQAGEFKQLEADLQMAQGQIDINKIEAASEDPFKSGWRPFIGWVCGVGFAVQFVVGPIGTWISDFYGDPIPFPQMDMTTMMPLVFGLLGLGAYRSYDKVQKIKGGK
jgi:hypothetical protein